VGESTGPVSTGEHTNQDINVPTHEIGEDEPRFTSGERIGRYVLLSSIGKGGFSVVYLAYDPELDRKVALKLMRMTMLGEKGKLRLQREAQALAKLSHPNVVPVYDAGTVADQAFVAMEFVEGKTLRKWLREDHTWPERLAVMLDAGRGLVAAHAVGLVHRDFKPDNVLIGEDGRVRVADFGLARLVSLMDGSTPPSQPSLDDPPSEAGVPLVPSSSPGLAEVTRADQLIGTPAYMAPEQMRREPTDERADQFAFCVALYEALYGVRPFEVSAEALASAASTADLSTLATTRVPRGQPRGTKVPTWMHRVLMRGMRDDPAARWPTMDALLTAITRDPMRKWRRAALGVAVFAAFGGAVFAVERSQDRARAMCDGGATRVASVWGPTARADVASAFAKTGVTYADTATHTITQALDSYARDWAAMNDEACAATRLRGEQSTDVLDLRTACLSDRLKELNALVDVMRHADVETVQQASRASQSLGPLADCADIAALRAPTPRPRDPAAAAKVEDLRARLAIVQANYAVGRATDAAKLGDALLVDAKSVDFGPLVAQVDFWRGRAFADLGDSENSIPAFRDAFTTALASRSDRVLRESAARLAQEYVYASDTKSFDAWAQIADAANARTGPDPDAENFVDHVRCVAMWQSGKVRSRLACLEKYTQRVERQRKPNDWELVTMGLAASDAGDLAKGVEYLRRAQQYSLEMNGASHPRTLEMGAYLCKGMADYGDLEGALRLCEETRKKVEEVAADNTELVGTIRLYAGEALLLMGHYDEAKKQLELAKALVHANKMDEVLLELAYVADATGKDNQSLAFFKTSLDAATKELPPEHANVLESEYELANAQLARDLVPDARAILDHAMASLARAEVSPLTAADLQFAYARAVWRTVPADDASRARAVSLAEQARDGYAKYAPPTLRYQDERHKIEAWLAAPDVRGLPCLRAPGGAVCDAWSPR
jgi:predicted Ser/Thr protein kinase